MRVVIFDFRWNRVGWAAGTILFAALLTLVGATRRIQRASAPVASATPDAAENYCGRPNSKLSGRPCSSGQVRISSCPWLANYYDGSYIYYASVTHAEAI